MIPVLYDSITEGTVPSSFGVGALTDCLSASVKESRNGEYELTLEYAAGGIHSEEIAPLKIIKAKPNFTDDPQLFEVYKVGKVLNGRFTVNAHHISYRLSNKVITTGSAGSCVAACALLEASAGNFTIRTDKTTQATFRVLEPSSVRSWFGGKAGSLLDKYGGEWKYDNFTAELLQARGMDRGVTIHYGKNLTSLSQEINIENLATSILPFYKDQDGNVTTGASVATGLILDTPREMAHDFSNDVDPESATPIVTQLATLAARYVSNNNFTVAINSIKLDFAQSGSLTERVDLCDTVKIYFDALGLSASAKCIETVWDVLQERYTSCSFGDPRVNIVDTITAQGKEIAEKPSTSAMAEAIDRATALISGNLGGYVVLHDSNGDGEPDEILIMETADITTATKVWRWNKNGLGYSSSGYSGPYGLAMTADGEIVADFITTGTLNADLIKAGTIQDAQGNSSINMTTGAAILDYLKAKHAFTVVDENDTMLATAYKVTNGGSFQVANSSGQAVATLYAQAMGGAVSVGFNNGNNAVNFFASTYGGILRLRDANDNMAVILETISSGGRLRVQNVDNSAALTLSADAAGGGVLDLTNGSGVTAFKAVSDDDGGLIQIKNTNDDLAVQIAVTSEGGGVWFLNDSLGSREIEAIGETGEIYCVVLHQSSSRKIKENIKPIEDAAEILKLQAVSFDYKNKKLGTNKRGFIAEDVEKVLPNLVTPENNGKPASLDYIGMIPYLQEIIKEHESRIAELEKTIAELKK